MQDVNNRRNVFFTSSVINSLYNLRSTDVIYNDNVSYSVSQATIGGTSYAIGLCSKNYHYHILTSFEKELIDILLSWSEISKDEDNSYIEKYTENEDEDYENTIILFDDIDWMRNRNKTNKKQRENDHILYKTIIEGLGNLLFIFDKLETIEDYTFTTYNLFNYKYVYKDDSVVGIEYNFGELQISLLASNQKVGINYNPFRYSRNNHIKYQIFRCLLVYIYMNRKRKGKSSFKRSHNSILKAVIYYSDTKFISYYDVIISDNHINTYLNRYIKQVLEILEDLKQIDFIHDYVIVKDTSRRHLVTSAGYIEIENVSYKKRKYR